MWSVVQSITLTLTNINLTLPYLTLPFSFSLSLSSPPPHLPESVCTCQHGLLWLSYPRSEQSKTINWKLRWVPLRSYRLWIQTYIYEHLDIIQVVDGKDSTLLVIIFEECESLRLRQTRSIRTRSNSGIMHDVSIEPWISRSLYLGLS